MLQLSGRRNMMNRQAETWRPMLPPPPKNVLAHLADAVRRFLDLQACSVWKDLSQILPQVRGTLVDVGCGMQPYRRLLGADARYVGIDTADAKEHFGCEMPDTTYYAGATWPVADASADAVLCTETLEHVAEPQEFLREAARCLHPGGLLILTVPFAARWHFIPHDYWRYTPSGLGRLLTRTGFVNASVYARGNALTVACYKSMALMLPLILPQRGGVVLKLLKRIAGIPLVPLLFLAAGIANLSLRGRGGDDCLGYTVLAEKRAS